MTIRLSLGNVGSGKTACEVREMMLSPRKILTYTNIKVIGDNTEHIKFIKPEMILTKTVQRTIKKKDGTNEDVEKLEVNVDFWKEQPKPLNIILDEAHNILNSRRSFSRKNVKVAEWLALIRRVLGDEASGEGELVFLTQLSRRVDVILREQAHNIRYHVAHYRKSCKDKRCGYSWSENSESPEPLWVCPKCGDHEIKKHNFVIQIWCFPDIYAFEMWKEFGEKTYYKEYLVNDIEETAFKHYNTYQWDSLFSDY